MNIYIYICIHIHIHINEYIYNIFIHIHIHMNEYLFIFIHIHVNEYISIGSFDDTDTLFGETFQLNQGDDSVTGNRKEVSGKDSMNTGIYIYIYIIDICQ
jgi:hypothetical protein